MEITNLLWSSVLYYNSIIPQSIYNQMSLQIKKQVPLNTDINTIHKYNTLTFVDCSKYILRYVFYTLQNIPIFEIQPN